MKVFFTVLLSLLFCTCFCYAGGKKWIYEGKPRTEVELVHKVLNCLRNKDSMEYYYNFPPFDTLWYLVTHNADRTPEIQAKLSRLKEHPTVLIDLDPFYNHEILGRFCQTLHKGEDSGVNWRGIILQRYELQKQEATIGMEGLEGIVPERFKGYIFVRDLSSATTFCITITEIQKIQGYFYGGQVLNILEAADIDSYMDRERAERRYYARQKLEAAKAAADSANADTTTTSTAQPALANIDSLKPKRDTIPPLDTATARKNKLLSSSVADDDAAKQRREVVDRRFYKGMFDDEIPVELYVRYMKDAKGKVTNWDALYKFGDMPKYIKLDVSKDEEGKWIFEEPVATMDLELQDKVYSGSWTNGINQTGYDVELLQKQISQEKIFELDKILETGTWGRTDQQTINEKDEDDKKETRKERRKRKREEKKKEEEKEKKEEEKKDKERKKDDSKDNAKKDNDGSNNNKADEPATQPKSAH
ncbi:MAG: hypothetical protein EBX41_08160 [Chitinophagia bacterium]|nr:hypothetical protein [Chitinophagia bacterium]